MKRSLLLICFIMWSLGASLAAHAQTSLITPVPAPKFMIWSWQKIEDLSLLDVKKAGIALLVGRFTITGEKISCEQRLSRLKLAKGSYLEAVARVEVSRPPALEHVEQVAERLANAITKMVLLRHFNAVQIDFDARETDRIFYQALLGKLSLALPAEIVLSTTALASWSQGDLWLKKLVDNQLVKVDHVVPMFFTMGVGKAKALELLSENPPSSFNNKLSIGLSITDPGAIKIVLPHLNNYNQIYLFCSPGWNAKNLQVAEKFLNVKLTEENYHGN